MNMDQSVDTKKLTLKVEGLRSFRNDYVTMIDILLFF